MGKKCIIELEDKPFHRDGDFLYRVKGFNSLVFDMTGISKLTPYIEPDLEQIRKEAYRQGQEDLRESCVPQDEEAYGFGYNEGFQCGLDVAWEAARKIAHCALWDDYRTDSGKLSVYTGDVLDYYTASEAIEKIRQYEQEKKEKEEEKPIRAEDVMRQYLDEFCKNRWCCADCVLKTSDFTCGRGYSFTGITTVSDEEVRRAYAKVVKEK